MSELVTMDAKTLDLRETYRLLTGCVVPRPIAWITTCNADGCVNAAPFSSYIFVSHSAAMLAVNIGLQEDNLKDSARKIVATGEFVVNAATEASVELMHQSGAELPARCQRSGGAGSCTGPAASARHLAGPDGMPSGSGAQVRTGTEYALHLGGAGFPFIHGGVRPTPCRQPENASDSAPGRSICAGLGKVYYLTSRRLRNLVKRIDVDPVLPADFESKGRFNEFRRH